MSLRGKMINLFQQLGGLTDFQLEKLLKKNGNSIRPARIKLEKKGLITRTTNQIVNPETNGKYTIFVLSKRD
jgi:hypothetical protein